MGQRQEDLESSGWLVKDAVSCLYRQNSGHVNYNDNAYAVKGAYFKTGLPE